MRLTDRLEWFFNARAWQQLRVQPLDRVILPPAEFRRAGSYREFAALSRPETTLCTMPVGLSPDPHAYVASMTPADLKGQDTTPDLVGAARRGATRHAYHLHIASLNQFGGPPPTADNVQVLLNGRLRARPGRDTLIDDLLRHHQGVSRQIGPVSYFALGIARGWMPPPAYFAPHTDSGVGGGIRLFFPLAGSGPLVVPTALTGPRRMFERNDDVEDDTVIVRFPTFSQLGAGAAYAVPAGYMAAWRKTDLRANESGGPALAHATPPFRRASRPVVIMDVDYPHWGRPTL